MLQVWARSSYNESYDWVWEIALAEHVINDKMERMSPHGPTDYSPNTNIQRQFIISLLGTMTAGHSRHPVIYCYGNVSAGTSMLR